jgi:hypothetical protein
LKRNPKRAQAKAQWDRHTHGGKWLGPAPWLGLLYTRSS